MLLHLLLQKDDKSGLGRFFSFNRIGIEGFAEKRKENIAKFKPASSRQVFGLGPLFR
jgi:hypothetical protein